MSPTFDPSDPDAFLVELETLRGEDPQAALDELNGAGPVLGERPEARLLAADLNWELTGAEAARPLLESLVRDVPDYADARYMLGSLYEGVGEDEARVEEFLEVLRLDEGLDAGLDAEDSRELSNLIVETAEGAIEGLPEAFREKLAEVPVLVEPRPSEELVREGLDPRALGLFEGATDLDHENNETLALPTRIVLYSANLLAESIDEDQLKAEVVTTVLHELGHYFGLEEEDLTRLGLD